MLYTIGIRRKRGYYRFWKLIMKKGEHTFLLPTKIKENGIPIRVFYSIIKNNNNLREEPLYPARHAYQAKKEFL